MQTDKWLERCNGLRGLRNPHLTCRDICSHRKCTKVLLQNARISFSENIAQKLLLLSSTSMSMKTTIFYKDFTFNANDSRAQRCIACSNTQPQQYTICFRMLRQSLTLPYFVSGSIGFLVSLACAIFYLLF